MEPEYWDKNPFKATTKAFPSGFHFKPTAINKTRTFYEFFSIDSNSISIKYLKDPNDPLLKTHSTIQILKVLQPRQFGPNLHEIKIFSVPLDPRGYTYWDYMDAWTKRWQFFGPIPKIFPEQIHGFVKWWNQFDASKAEPDKKSQLAAFLAESNCKEHLTKNLKEVLKLLQSQEQGGSSSKKEDTNSSENDDDFYQNEDNCFVITLCTLRLLNDLIEVRFSI
ncbi:hypothetical protein GmHk_12G034454 [Glycine max]|nr:hypothetical protein GmHk_12G034454 [Glycine max]